MYQTIYIKCIAKDSTEMSFQNWVILSCARNDLKVIGKSAPTFETWTKIRRHLIMVTASGDNIY